MKPSLNNYRIILIPEIICIKYYFIVSLRNISKHKLSAFFNISELSIGMICCILILLFVQHEYSYNKFHEKKIRYTDKFLNVREQAELNVIFHYHLY